jgi:hypothetical protein
MPKFIAAILVASVVAGCGSGADTGSTADGPSPAETAAQEKQAAKDKAEATYANCKRDLGGFVTSLSELDSRLGVGLSYDEYTTKVGDVKVAYDNVPFKTLEAACVAGVGLPAEKALNQHAKAATEWGNCQSDINCSNDSVKPTLQKYWLKASTLTQRAKSKLEGLRTP